VPQDDLGVLFLPFDTGVALHAKPAAVCIHHASPAFVVGVGWWLVACQCPDRHDSHLFLHSPPDTSHPVPHASPAPRP
jgi:hypothetical protein